MALSQAQKDRVQALVYDEYLVDSDDDETGVDREATAAAYEALMGQIESPEELHAYASEFNWDCGCNEMRDVIRHPLCDMGTALLIYWHACDGRMMLILATAPDCSITFRGRVRDMRTMTRSRPINPLATADWY